MKVEDADADSLQESPSTGRRSRGAAGERNERAPALSFLGVTRSRGWRGARTSEDLTTVRYRDLEALVRPAPYRMPALSKQQLQAHQRMVEAAMRRDTILPAPYGIVFRGRRQVIRFLEDQYIVLDEALAFLEGHWELRLHIKPAAEAATPETVTPEALTPEIVTPELHDLAMHLYSELRRFARAAVPLEGADLLSAAFLVDRTAWIEFVERADDMNASNPEVAFDITGPWPPYDFVKMSA